jgi:capsular exopolysaccharide synthesis family protein
MRRPTAHKNLNLPNESGLSDVLNGLTILSQAIKKLDHGNLFMLTAGTIPSNPADLISVGFQAIVEAASREFDLVIIDAPPILGVSETRELSRFVDGVILVTKANATSGKIVSEALAALTGAGATVIGLVMNQVKPAHFSNYHYSYYGTKSAV